MILEITYLSYLSRVSLSRNRYLANIYYNKYSDKDNYKEIKYIYSDKELNEFLINLAETYTGMPTDIEITKKGEELVMNYYRLDDLVKYIHDIIMYEKEHSKMLEEKCIWHPKLHDFLLPDSRLISFKNDIINRTCSMKLKGVTLYGDRRINRKVEVDSGTIEIRFTGVKKVEMVGELSMVDRYMNCVYKDCIIETDEKLLNFCLMAFAGWIRPFLFQVEFTDFEVKQIV